MNDTIGNHRKRVNISQTVLNIVFILICACYIIPLCMIITIAFSDTQNVASEGFKIIPTEIDFTAIKIVFSNTRKIVQAYFVTITSSLMHTVLSVILQGLIAYPMSRSYFPLRKGLTGFVFLTMLFSAGLIPTYIVYTKFLHLNDTIWVHVLPGAVSAWNVMIVRTFYMGLPGELNEAARIDGAGEFRTFLSIIVPLAKPCYATVGFLTLVSKWNDWYTSLVYIRSPKLYSLQYLLQTMLRNIESIKEMQNNFAAASDLYGSIASEPVRFAMALVAAGPVLLIFPLFQKHFSKGMVIGAVKG